MTGTLLLTLIDASLIRDTELIGAMDPFVHCAINQIVQRSRVHDDGGKTPRWNQQMVFRCQPGDRLMLTVYDEEKFERHDLVGTGEYSVRVEEEGGLDKEQQMSLAIYYKAATAGHLNIKVLFLRDGLPRKNMNEELQKEKEEEARQIMSQQIAQRRQSRLQVQTSKVEILELIDEINNLKDTVQAMEQQAQAIKEVQRVCRREQENAQLQTTEIAKQAMENVVKSQVYQQIYKQMREGTWEGRVHIRRCQLVYHSRQIAKGKVSVIIGYSDRDQPLSRLCLDKQKIGHHKEYHWNNSLAIDTKALQSMLLQVYHWSKFTKELQAQGSISLLVLREKEQQMDIPMYRGDKEVMVLRARVRFIRVQRPFMSEI